MICSKFTFCFLNTEPPAAVASVAPVVSASSKKKPSPPPAPPAAAADLFGDDDDLFSTVTTTVAPKQQQQPVVKADDDDLFGDDDVSYMFVIACRNYYRALKRFKCLCRQQKEVLTSTTTVSKVSELKLLISHLICGDLI